VSNAALGSYAKRIGLEPGLKITAVVAPAPGRPSRWVVYGPALALLGLIWWIQRRRAAADPRPRPLTAPVPGRAAA